MVPMHHGWLWFPNKAGLISGIIIGGFGLGALIFSPLATFIVNPGGEQAINGKFSNDVNERVPRMLLTMDACFLALCIISALLVFPGPDPTNFNQEIKKLDTPLPSIPETPSDNQTDTLSRSASIQSSYEKSSSLRSGKKMDILLA